MFEKFCIGVFIILTFFLAGCATKVEYVYLTKTVQVPVTIPVENFTPKEMTAPPEKRLFFPKTIVTDKDAIAVLQVQRDLLVGYSQSLMMDVKACHFQLESVAKIQEKTVSILEGKP